MRQQHPVAVRLFHQQQQKINSWHSNIAMQIDSRKWSALPETIQVPAQSRWLTAN